MRTDKNKIYFKKGDLFGEWTLVKFLNKGGHGEVWEVENKRNEKAAIKLLRTVKAVSYNRFRDEIEVVKKNADINGLLPIKDCHLPINIKGSIPWYIMPLATPLQKHLNKEDTISIIKKFISLATTLIDLHTRKISHRDIKPGNLFFLNGIPCFGDFGLVDYPDKKDLTQKGEPVGPKWTVAPEMKRDAKRAEGTSADIYSFAKTIWIFLTKQNKGFDGQYSKETIIALDNFLPNIYTTPLDTLLYKCTDNDPLKRPTINEFQEGLKAWLKANEDYQTRNKLQWIDIQKEFFPSNIPNRVVWEKAETIVNILKKLALTEDLCHVFIPTGGGSDLIGAYLSYEENCIELDFGHTLICKPRRLVFESFDNDEEWNYFRLECDKLETSSYYQDSLDRETLTELKPLLYTDANCYEYNDFDGKRMPKNARLVDRILYECSFVIFRKTSTYNKVPATYDARHNKMTTDRFRSYIEDAVKALAGNKQISRKQSKQIKIIKPYNYRTKKRILTEYEIQLVNEVISLANLRDAESIEIDKKYNMEDGLMLHDPKSIDYVFETRKKEKDLEGFLNQLSEKQLLLIAAVMYGGRNSSPPWGTPLDEMIDSLNNITDLVESITEKVSLVEYLNKGIELYK
jgi:hypothetical protein